MMAFLRGLLNLPPGAGSLANHVDLLHFFVIGTTMLAAGYVFTMATVFTVRYARRRHHQLTRPLVVSPAREALTIMAILGTFLLWWAIGFHQYTEMRTVPEDADVVYVDAKQWMWKFAYADGRAANDFLTVPVGRPIKLVMTSRDVIHSFYVPAFRLKQDVVPGRYTTLWFTATEAGNFPIWCAEYCGVSHSYMRGQVIALPQEEYAIWRQRDGRPLVEGDCGEGPGTCGGEDLVTKGRQVAERRQCLACHTLDGQSHVGPSWLGLYGAEQVLDDGRRVIADDAYLTRSMMEPGIDVVRGYRDVMPTYQGVLEEAEVAALVELIRSIRERPIPSGVGLPTLDITGSTPGDAGPPLAPGVPSSIEEVEERAEGGAP